MSLPEIDLRHVLVLTDDTGMLQHSGYATPDPEHGYCTDDNARALIAAVYTISLSDEALKLPARRYLGFLDYAFNDDSGRFRNFMGYDRHWLEEEASPDSHGRAVWGLGAAVRWAPDKTFRRHAVELFHRALPALERFDSPRTQAFALIGLDAFLAAIPGDERASRARETLAGRLFEQWRVTGALDATRTGLRRAEAATAAQAGGDPPAGGEWPWPEDTLTYANAKLPHALIVSGAGLDRKDMVEAGLGSLRWLLEVHGAGARDGEKGHVSLIGNDGWYERGGKRAQFDQQPLDAHALVHACLDAAKVTGDDAWEAEARRCFEWFTGRNDLGAPLYDPETGGGRDGLTPYGPNLNQGAESTLAYVLSVLELHMHARRKREARGGPSPRRSGYGRAGGQGGAQGRD